MRICLISREYPPETGFGGIATFTQHLAHGLKNLGHEVVVVALAKENAKVVDDNGVTIHRVPLYPFKSKLAVVAMCMPYTKYVLGASTALWDKFYELHAQKPFDVVDTPELLAEGIYPAVTQVAPLVIRLYTPHSKFIAEKLHNVVPSFDHQLVAALERVAMLSADVLTSPSLDLAEFVAGDLGTALSDIKLVRNPIDTSVFIPEGELALPRTAKLRVLFVGRLEERKGIPYLVEAIPQVVAKFKNVEFVIIGDDTKTGKGGASVLESLKHSLAESGCAGYVTFIDRIALSALPSYYRSADISMVPSVYDNSPYTSLEAMACGVPVIGSSAGGTKEYVIDGKTGIIIPPRDSQAIAQALLRLLENETERKTMAANARTHAVESFDRTEIARQTALLYEEAGRSFKARQEAGFSRKLYHHDLEQVTGSATHFLDSFDKALYDMLYQQSIRFRIVHWWRLGKARPKLLGAKLVNRLGRSIMKVLGTRDENMPQSLKRLEGSIIEKDKERQNHELAGRKN